MGSTPEIRAAAAERRSLARVSPERQRLRGTLLPLLVFALGAAMTLVVFALVENGAEERQRRQFERRAAEVADRLRAELEVPLTVLESIPALMMAMGDIERSEFGAFVRPALREHRSVAALEWLPLVRNGQREAFETRARADGFAGFVFTELAPDGSLVPAAERDVYVPIYYMEPADPSALGFDVLSEAGRRATAMASMRSGQVVVSPRFQLVEDPLGVYSLAVYAPVYSRFPTPSTEEERMRTFRGFGIEIFRLAPVLDAVTAGLETAGIELVAIDAHADDERALLYETRAGLSRADTGAAWVWSSSFPFADRRYELRFVASAELMAGVEHPWMLLAGGLALSVLAGFGLWGIRSILRLRGEMARALKLGRYTLVEKLGEGGMGVVYKARHAMLRRPTALKLLRATNEKRLVRFEREVQLTSQLTHPNTIAIYDYGRTPDGIFYYAMEYLEGITLEELIRFDGPQDPSRVVHLLSQACGSLAEAHAVGLIHRDVKPANLMLTRRGGLYDFVKVLDFGLVKDLGAREDVTVSVDAGFLGTPLYLSPEAIEEPDSLDGRADLYALGAVGYALLTATPVFTGSSKMAVLTQHLTTDPEPPSERLGKPLPAELEALLLKCLAKRPDDRPASASAVRRSLDRLTDVPRWRQADAERWWTERAGEVLEGVAEAHRAALEDGDRPSHRTVDVALGDRGSRRS